MNAFELIMIAVAIIVVIVVIYKQWTSYKETKEKIDQLASFFPKVDSLQIKPSSITKDILNSKSQLHTFLSNPPERHVEEDTPVPFTDIEDLDENELDEEAQSAFIQEEKIEYYDVNLVKVDGKSNAAFNELVYETNAYLCKNVGTSADFSLLQDICERKIDMLESQITSEVNVPLYYGLGGTFLGIIIGLAGIAVNVDSLFAKGNMTPLQNLLIGVAIAMVASLFGLFLMTKNSATNHKKAMALCEKNKNGYYDFLRRELMPMLSNSMASSLNSLKGVLGEFIGKFGHNLDAYANSAELLNDNIEKQHLLLIEINKMKQKEMAMEIAEAFGHLKDSADSLNVFNSYQENLNNTIENVDTAVGRIEDIVDRFDDFANALNVVVENQRATTELQNQFRTAIERNFPTGSDARELYRRQFDELVSDAREVSTELNAQLVASTEHIKSFVDGNKSAFDSLTQLGTVLNRLIEYTDVQASCYRDLKQEIQNLKQEQIKTQQNATKLNSDLLTAVKEMTAAAKSIKG